MSYLVIDIETSESNTSESIKQHIFESITPDARLTDPVKIASDIEKKKAKIVDAFPLKPYSGQVTAVGFLDPDKSTIFYQDNEGRQDEEAILKFAWEWLKNELPGRTLVSFNGKNFDIPFFLLRSSFYQIQPTIPIHLLSTSPYEYKQHCDLFCFFGEKSLTFWETFFGFERQHPELNGSEMSILYKNKDREKIQIHLLDDLQGTEKVYNAVRSYLP